MLSLQAHFEQKVNLWRERLSCGSPDCRSARRFWGRLSDGAASIKLHGQCFCFPICFEQALRRKLSEWPAPPGRRSRPAHRIPLGLLMLSRGELNDQQLRHALEAQRHNGGGRIGEWMRKLGYVNEDRVTAALGAQWSIPVLRSLPAGAAACAVPLPLLRAFEMVPVHYAPATRMLHMAFARDIEYRALLAIEQVLDCTAEPCLASLATVQSILDRLAEERRGSDLQFEDTSSPEEMCRITSSYAGKLGADEVRVARSGDYTWIRIRARKHSANLIFSGARRYHSQIDERQFAMHVG